MEIGRIRCHTCGKILREYELKNTLSRNDELGPAAKHWCNECWESLQKWIKEKKDKENRIWFSKTLPDLERRFSKLEYSIKNTKKYFDLKKDANEFKQRLKSYKLKIKMEEQKKLR